MGHVAIFSQSPEPDPEYQAPADAEEFWTRDWTYVCKFVSALLRNGQESPDVAADIMEKLVTRKVYELYVPGTVSQHTKRKVSWRAFLSAQVALYVRGKGEQVTRRLYREPLLCDAPAGDGSSRWVEMFGGQVWDDYPSLSDSDFVIRIREQLADLPPWEGISLLALFEEVLSLVKDGEKVTLSYLRRKFGTAAPGAFTQLREAISGPVTVPVTYEVGGLQLTAAEVRDAAEALKGWKGNQVRRAFTATGHRLAGAGTQWYLDFAEEEIAQFPELNVPKKSHKDGHQGFGRVKTALIHRLERMVALVAVPEAVPAPAPEPEEDPDPEEVLEYRLRRLGAGNQDVEELLDLARQAFGAAC